MVVKIIESKKCSVSIVIIMLVINNFLHPSIVCDYSQNTEAPPEYGGVQRSCQGICDYMDMHNQNISSICRLISSRFVFL